MEYLSYDIVYFTLYDYLNVYNIMQLRLTCCRYYEIFEDINKIMYEKHPSLLVSIDVEKSKSLSYENILLVSIIKKITNEQILNIGSLYNNISFIIYAIEKGADDFNWAMTYAAENNHVDLVKFFIEKGADDFNWAMTNAAKNNHIDLVKFLKSKQ